MFFSLLSHRKNSKCCKIYKKQFIEKYHSNKWRWNTNKRFTYDDDLADAIYKCAVSNIIKCDILQISSYKETSINQLSEIIIHALNEDHMLTY